MTQFADSSCQISVATPKTTREHYDDRYPLNAPPSDCDAATDRLGASIDLAHVKRTFAPFLEQYPGTQMLDGPEFDKMFPVGCHRADYLLFGGDVICELKEIVSFDVGKRAETVARKGPLDQSRFKRDMYNRLNKVLHDGAGQIRDTRQALHSPDALGLIILENQIPANMSVMTLVDAAERKLLGGLDGVDAVLCADNINVFFAPDRKPITSTLTVARPTPSAARCCEFTHRLIQDLCHFQHVPFLPGHDLASGTQQWQVDTSGRYKGYHASMEFRGD